MHQQLSYCIIGAGNVGWHLAQMLAQNGIKPVQVYSRNETHAIELSERVGCSYTTDIQAITRAQAYLFTLSDSAIEPVLKMRSWNNALLLHTAGSVAMEVFKPYSVNYGVLYPLQSFTKNRTIEAISIPFLIEAANKYSEETIENLASAISGKFYSIDSETRAKIHLAAVFASNYVNYMLAIAMQIMDTNGLDQNLLKPLIEETIAKAFEMGPLAAQTGPARRNNREILGRHIAMLAQHPDWQKIYTFVAESITGLYNKK